MAEPLFSVQELALPGVRLITPRVHTDVRGTSSVTYTKEDFAGLGIDDVFIQDYTSYSKQGVLRGLHFQKAPHGQNKLIRVVSGRIFDLALDFDPASPTYGQHVSWELDAEKGEMLYIPGRYAHGFYVLSEGGAFVEYKMNASYAPESASGIRYDDPAFTLPWPGTNPILSEQDQSWPLTS